MRTPRPAALALALALPLLAGCGLRLDEPDPSPAPPSAAEELRQREALRAAAYAESGAAVGAAGGVLAGHAADQLEALGGVWEPWPQGDGPTDPDGVALYPSPTADIGPFRDAADLVDSLATTTPEVCEAALTAREAEGVALYGAICLSRTFDWDALAREAGVPGPMAPMLPERVGTQDANLVRTIDAAAWAADYRAAVARAAEDETWRVLENQAREYRELALAITAANGWTGTADDPRLASYDASALPDDDAVDVAFAHAAIAALPNSTDRQGVLDMALHHGLRAQQVGEDFGSLPGLD
ncbi:MAG TPA: hypothetical protein GX743_05210 [Actinomycetales bacterium]|nr:hypothetical protein [Actinomycetales bacterium]